METSQKGNNCQRPTKQSAALGPHFWGVEQGISLLVGLDDLVQEDQYGLMTFTHCPTEQRTSHSSHHSSDQAGTCASTQLGRTKSPETSFNPGPTPPESANK
eukprot:3624503-Amphidinium_carterae.1